MEEIVLGNDLVFRLYKVRVLFKWKDTSLKWTIGVVMKTVFMELDNVGDVAQGII